MQEPSKSLSISEYSFLLCSCSQSGHQAVIEVSKIRLTISLVIITFNYFMEEVVLRYRDLTQYVTFFGSIKTTLTSTPGK